MSTARHEPVPAPSSAGVGAGPAPDELDDPATPLVPARSLGRLVGLGRLWLKLECQRRGGSWLDRAAARVVARARAAGASGLVTVGGDGLGPALALRAGPAGLPTILVASELDALVSDLAWAVALGARLVRVAGDQAVLRELLPELASGHGLIYVDRADDALREGVREAGLELAAQLGGSGSGPVPADVLAVAALVGGEGGWLVELMPAGAEPAKRRRGRRSLPRSGIVVEGRYGGPDAVAAASFDVAQPGSVVVTAREADAARRLLAREEGILASRRGVAGLVALMRAAVEKILPPDALAVVLLANEVGGADGPPLAVEEAPPTDPVPLDLLGERLREARFVPPR